MNQEKKHFRWIDEDIVLDFRLPVTLKNTIEEIEQADLDGNMGEYCVLSDIIDVLCKDYCAEGIFTREQWELVCQKFPYDIIKEDTYGNN